MRQESKHKILIGGVVLCLVIIAGLGYNTWSLNQKVGKLEANTHFFFNSMPFFTSSGNHNTQFNTMMKNFPKMPQSFAGINQWMNQVMHQVIPSNMIQNIAQLQGANLSPHITFKNHRHRYEFIVHFAKGQHIQINSEISNHVLHISGSLNQKNSQKSQQFMSNSQFSSEFSQSYTLNQPVDQNTMKIIHHKHEIDIIILKKHHS